jgi:hypothetical protein
MLNQAESDAIKQILTRLGDVLDKYEKDLLQQILDKHGK